MHYQQTTTSRDRVAACLAIVERGENERIRRLDQRTFKCIAVV